MEESPSPALKKKLPVALLVIAIIGIVYAGSGLAGALQCAIYAPLMQLFSGFMNSLSRSYDSVSVTGYAGLFAGLVPYFLLLAAIGLPVYTLGLIACIGALKRKPWSRTGMMIFSVLLFAEAVVTAVVVFAMINPLMQYMEHMPGSGYSSFSSTFLSAYSTIIRAVLIVSLPLSCVLPTVMLVILNKPAVKEHYRELRGVSA